MSHPGLPSLEKLILNNVTLNVDNLLHLTVLIEHQKVPNLKDLKLSPNDFKGLEDEIYHLINAFIINHQTELKLGLMETKINEELINKWQSQCEGTYVKICSQSFIRNYKQQAKLQAKTTTIKVFINNSNLTFLYKISITTAV